MRDERWNFCTAVGYEDEEGDELFELSRDPEERDNVAADHPQVVAACRAELEALLGQPLPGHRGGAVRPGRGADGRVAEPQAARALAPRDRFYSPHRLRDSAIGTSALA